MTDPYNTTILTTWHWTSPSPYRAVAPLFGVGTFTRSDGSVAARVYERLTKASRRRSGRLAGRTARKEQAYREGVKEALEAIRAELS